MALRCLNEKNNGYRFCAVAIVFSFSDDGHGHLDWGLDILLGTVMPLVELIRKLFLFTREEMAIGALRDNGISVTEASGNNHLVDSL